MAAQVPLPHSELPPQNTRETVAWATAGVERVPLPAEAISRLRQQVRAYAVLLRAGEMGSPDFRADLAAAGRIGRQSIASASALIKELASSGWAGVSGEGTYAGMARLRRTFESLDPRKAGDLLAPHRIFGVIPYGTRLQAYLRKYSAASAEVASQLAGLNGERARIEREITRLNGIRSRLWGVAVALKEAAAFADWLDSELSADLPRLREVDLLKAEAIEQDAVVPARQACTDVLAQLTIVLNAYRQSSLMVATGRDLLGGIERLAVTGMNALAIAQSVARAMGAQRRAAATFGSGPALLEELITGSPPQPRQAPPVAVRAAADPVAAVETLLAAADRADRALEALEKMRVPPRPAAEERSRSTFPLK